MPDTTPPHDGSTGPPPFGHAPEDGADAEPGPALTGFRRVDPGSHAARTLALLAGLLGLLVVFALQQFQPQPGPPPARTAEQLAEAANQDPLPDPGGLGMSGKLMLRLGEAMPGVHPTLAGQIRAAATDPADRPRAAVLLAELEGTDAAINQLDQLDAALDPDAGAPDERDLPPGLGTDSRTLRTIYSQGPGALDQDQRDRLVRRLGDLGTIALAHGPGGIDAADPERAAIVSGGFAILGFGLGLFALIGSATVVGLILLIMALVRADSGKLRPAFDRPAPGGSVYLELFAVFVWGFLSVQLIGGLLSAVISPEAIFPVSVALQWSLLLLAFLYPRFRGVPRQLARAQLGLHRGKGFWREVRAGCVGYIAGVPIYLGAVLATALLLVDWAWFEREVLGSGESAPPQNPLAEIVAGGSTLQVVLLFTLATIWAPLVEELVFRGGLYRHMRSRVIWPVAAIGSTIAFAMMHGYSPLLLIPVATLGLIFGALREWRGSLIAPIVAHLMHNFITLSVSITVFRVLAS